jgi:G3E family GTPase
MNTGRFDFNEAADAPGWLKELRGEHVPETEEYGISSFVYRAHAPFHPQRLWHWLNQEWPGVIRSKGHFWIATRPEFCVNWSQAGAITRTELAGFWWAATPNEYWPTDEEQLKTIQARWQQPYGDRQQELVIIGIDMNRAEISAGFDDCLLTTTELDLGMEAWKQLADPFPVWRKIEEEAEEEMA